MPYTVTSTQDLILGRCPTSHIQIQTRNEKAHNFFSQNSYKSLMRYIKKKMSLKPLKFFKEWHALNKKHGLDLQSSKEAIFRRFLQKNYFTIDESK